MNNTYPCIKVCDIETTIQWYVDFLGFQCTFKSTIKQPNYALLEKGNLKIYLAKSNNREAYASNILIIETSDIKEEFIKDISRDYKYLLLAYEKDIFLLDLKTFKKKLVKTAEEKIECVQFYELDEK